jgi:hypothetical protein
MKLNSLLNRFGGRRALETFGPPALGDAVRFPYGPFRFKSRLPKGRQYAILASNDVRTWTTIARDIAGEEAFEYIDSDAFKFSYRFYRLQTGELFSANIIGYAAVTLPPGFSMIANPFDSAQTVAEIFADWPPGTTVNKFDTRLFRLAENGIKDGQWTNTSERLLPGEGAIFFNPTLDYKSVSFVGQVLTGNLSLPIPAGFSIRSSLVPQAGNLVDDLHFPIADGDVIHIFDREGQKYVLHPYEGGKWTAGPPILSVGEAFWVAKTAPGNWIRNFVVER